MKIRNLIVFGLIALLFGISSCRDDFDYDIASKNLSFSSDTLNLDTIFNHTNSQTYKLTIHNHENKDIQIPRIYLSRGESSFFKLNVDGMPGSDFENVAIRKKDSIFVFVEIAAGEAPVIPEYEDEINFETTNGTQQVKLLSYIEKAEFYIPEQGQTNHNLTETLWDNSKSRVVFGNLHVMNGLYIQGGTRVYFHNGAGLTIDNGDFTVDGSINNEVIFRTDRMDERSDSLPNNWNKILIKNNPVNDSNLIKYAIIKGGNIGLEIENSHLEISNSKILNNEKIGLYAKNAVITGYNLVINNSDIASLAIEGGIYDFRHCTFANYHNIGQGAGQNFSLYLSSEGNLLNAHFYNSIFYGHASDAVYIDETTSGNIIFDSNIIKGQTPLNAMNTYNEDPIFVNPGFGKNDLRLYDGSHAKDKGSSTYLIPYDIKGYLRDSIPNLGAYEELVPTE